MRKSIRTRLSLTFIGLAIIPLLIVGTILSWRSFTIEQQQALMLQREVARRVAIEVTTFFEKLENELHLVSKAQVLPELDSRKRQGILKLLITQNVFEDVVLLDNLGQEQVRLSRLGLFSTSRANYADADEFLVPLTSRQVYYSPVRFEKTTGEPLITMAVPLIDLRAGQVSGVLVSEIRMKKIWDVIADVRVSPGQNVYIVDAQEKVVAHRNPSVVLRDTHFPVPEHDGIQSGITGKKTVLAVETLHFGEQTFHVVAEQIVSEALALAISTVAITAVLIVAALLIAGSLGFLSVRQIIRPIQAMATTAEAISAGDLSQQVNIIDQDELGMLATAFNSMTAQLRTIITGLEQQITGRKQAEHALRESEERLRQIASSLRETIWLHDVQTRQILYVNPAFKELTGWTCESFYENQDIVKDAIHPDDKEWVIKAFEQRFDGVPFDIEHRIIHLDGLVRWVASRSFPVRNEAGEVYRWASIMEDITERKHTENEIRQLNAELENRVKARTAELEFANRELKDFAYVVSHDLKSPLRAISRLTSWLGTDYAGAFDEEGHEMLELLIGRVSRMDNLIDGILEYSRIGRMDTMRFPVDLGPLVGDVLDTLASPEHIRTTMTGDFPTLSVEKTRIFQVFQNLIGNAIKFLDKPQGEIEIRCEEEELVWRFCVADNGPGIDPKYHKRIFQIFQTLHSRDEVESTGIGLAIVKKIVERHGGMIWLESEVGEGSRFFFTLAKTESP